MNINYHNRSTYCLIVSCFGRTCSHRDNGMPWCDVHCRQNQLHNPEVWHKNWSEHNLSNCFYKSFSTSTESMHLRSLLQPQEPCNARLTLQNWVWTIEPSLWAKTKNFYCQVQIPTQRAITVRYSILPIDKADSEVYWSFMVSFTQGCRTS